MSEIDLNIAPKENGQRDYLSPLKNPFAKNKACKVWCHMMLQSRGYWTVTGNIQFQNGMTIGEQKFEAESFEDLIKQMDLFIKNLE